MENEKVCQNSILEDIDFLKMFIKICPNTKLCYLYYSVDQNSEPKGQLLQWSLVFHVWSGYWSKIYKCIELCECLRDSGPGCFCGPGVRRKKKVCAREGGWMGEEESKKYTLRYLSLGSLNAAGDVKRGIMASDNAGGWRKANCVWEELGQKFGLFI